MAEEVTAAEVEVTTAEVEAATVAEVIAEAEEATEARATNLALWLWWLINKGLSRSCTHRQDLSCAVMNSRL